MSSTNPLAEISEKLWNERVFKCSSAQSSFIAKFWVLKFSIKNFFIFCAVYLARVISKSSDKILIVMLYLLVRSLSSWSVWSHEHMRKIHMSTWEKYFGYFQLTEVIGGKIIAKEINFCVDNDGLLWKFFFQNS